MHTADMLGLAFGNPSFPGRKQCAPGVLSEDARTDVPKNRSPLFTKYARAVSISLAKRYRVHTTAMLGPSI